MFSINSSSTGSGLAVLVHCHGFDDHGLLLGSSGTATHHTVNIPGV